VPEAGTPGFRLFWLFWLFWFLPVVCGGLVLARTRYGHERWRGELAVVAGLCVMAGMVNAGFLRDALRTRLADAIVPAVLLAAWVLGLCWRQGWQRRPLQWLARLASLVAVVASLAAAERIGEWPERFERTGVHDGLAGVRSRAREVSVLLSSTHRQALAPPSRVAGALMPFFHYLDRCTAESERLIVTGESPDIPVLAGRRFASDGVVLGAWYSSARHQDLTVDLLKTRAPLFVVYLDAAAFRSRFPLIEALVQEEFKPMADITVPDGGAVPILVRRARAPVATDPDTGWPCFK